MNIIDKLRKIAEALSHYEDVKRERDDLKQERAEIDNLVNEIYEKIPKQ